MKITAITCTTPERSDGMALCRRYMERQTRQPDQWIVNAGPEKMAEKVLRALPDITGELIVWIEDDDWYAPDWLEWIEQEAMRGFDLVGEGDAIYYNVRRRWWSECKNVRHASLCQTAMHVRMLEQLANTITAWDNPFFDCRLWRVDAARYLRLPRAGRRLCIGIKGMFETGYSPEHRQVDPAGAVYDPSMMKLWQLIGDDAEAYRSYFKRK